MYGYLRLEGIRLTRDVKFLMISLISPLFMYTVLSHGAAG